MSFIGSMVAAASAISAAAGGGILGGLAVGATGALGGAGLGAAASAIDGGDPLEGAQLGAGIGSAVFGGIGALGSAGVIGSAAPIAGSTAPIAGSALPTVSTEIGKEAIKAGTEEAIKAGTEEAIKAGTEQAVVQGTGQVANPGISALPAVDPTAAVNPASQAVVNSTPAQGAALDPAKFEALNSGVNSASASTGNTLNPAAAQTPGVHPIMPKGEGLAPVSESVGQPVTQADLQAQQASAASWGQKAANSLGTDYGTAGNKVLGKAIEGSVMNAGISGLMAGAQGEDVGKAMAMGAGTGAVGGAAGEGLASMAGPSNSGLEYIGNIAAKHDVLVPAALSMGSNMALSRMMPDSSDNGMPESSPLKSNYRWNPNTYKAYLPRGNSFGSFAAGGITDLDNYDQTPQMQSPGTLDIPNRNEVANNQGYMGDSVQMMADGGIAKESYMLEGLGGRDLHREASQDLRDFLEGTPDSELTTAQQRQKQILFAKKMAMGGTAYAHGGISDLGGYSDGGRLLKGPGVGVSDDIPASIGGKQPARLAEGEFVVPARIVSELGNGSTDAGAKRLYQMMDRIQSERRKTTGKGKFSDNPKAYKHLPA